MYSDTIVAISTPVGLGAVGIVRLSGDKAVKIASEIFSCPVPMDKFEPSKLYLGTVNATPLKDKCLAVVFRAPKSFTGEDVVEFQCHGGRIILECVVKETVKRGARLAYNGEFSRRAFLNGKMDLTSVEGMADMINAESEAAERLAYSQFKGGITEKVSELQSKLEDVIAYTEAAFDYPEEDVPPMDVPEVRDTVTYEIHELDKLISSYSLGRLVKNGVSVAILGKPNVGKSSILNALLGVNRAIVTDVAGTTRDVLTAPFNYKGVRFELFDTAGIREAKDEIEKIGVERALDVIDSADLLVLTLDSSRPLDEEDNILIEKIKNKRAIVVVNKNDLSHKIAFSLPKNLKVIYTSAKNNEGLEDLKEALYQFSDAEKLLSTESAAVSSERQVGALIASKESLTTALNGLNSLSADCLIIDLRNAWEKFGEITGTNASEHIIDTIFSKLCLGK